VETRAKLCYSLPQIAFEDVPLGEVTDWIGWDPALKRIRSWSLELDGFSEGSWTSDGERWVIKTVVLAKILAKAKSLI
jgi:hypothetical protein